MDMGGLWRSVCQLSDCLADDGCRSRRMRRLGKHDVVGRMHNRERDVPGALHETIC
jgi:hypothetical protein